jgi:hypothetical protein
MLAVVGSLLELYRSASPIGIFFCRSLKNVNAIAQSSMVLVGLAAG